MPGAVIYLRSEQFKGIMQLSSNHDVQDYVNNAVREKLQRDGEHDERWTYDTRMDEAEEIEQSLQKAFDSAVDFAVAELDCYPSDVDYQERRRYARERLLEYLFIREVVSEPGG